MMFSELPSGPLYFVVVRPGKSSRLMVKDGHGQFRTASDYKLAENHGIEPNTQVQQVHLK